MWPRRWRNWTPEAPPLSWTALTSPARTSRWTLRYSRCCPCRQMVWRKRGSGCWPSPWTREWTSLPTDEGGVYAASLRTDAACVAVPACVLSGWPALGDLVKLGSRCAIKEEWNRVLLASRAHRDFKEDVFRFLTSWC
ncbi:hypothetical protein B566_EDAN010041 [Ephemera danica]|nr:hypothetical protein B566_EDAN010041 [Ephemera danica]